MQISKNMYPSFSRIERKDKMYQIHVDSWRAGFALLCIAAIIGSGGVLAALIGFPKVYVLIYIGFLPWAGLGWRFGWRTWLAGFAAIVGAAAASTGEMYLLAGIQGVIAYLFLFGSYVPNGDVAKS